MTDLDIIDVTPFSVTFTRGGRMPVVAYLDELDAHLRKTRPEVAHRGFWLNEDELDRLRDAILDHARDATIIDHCSHCGTETVRTDRLCDSCHGLAEDTSELLRRNR